MSKGWIGVDLDGTLAENRPNSFPEIGSPIPRMVARVKAWLAEGREVRIVTARVGPATLAEIRRVPGFEQCVVEAEWTAAQTQAVLAWSAEHLGVWLKVTCQKDMHMLQLWDDRAVQVITDTGMSAQEHYEEMASPFR